ncbi:MAG TPA: hypothetical protein VJW77_17230 [Terriglobia bacterium]|nr:hypothetical protein [Terriglobia bacterium]
MELLTFNHSGYPRIGDSPDEQMLRRAIARHDAGEGTEAEVRAAEDRLILLALEEQHASGLDIFTDGLVRWNDPASHLAGKLQGVRINGLLRFFDTNFYFRQPVICGKVERLGPLVVNEFDWAAKQSTRPVKPVVTGPCTLGHLSICAAGSVTRGDLIMAFAEALATEVAELAAAGARLIQVDEPALLKRPADMALAREALTLIASRKGEAELALATYFGDAAPVYSELQALPVDTLVLDFTYSAELPSLIQNEGSTKRLALGVLDGRNTKIEDESATVRLIEPMLAKVNLARSYLTTSCSLEYLPRDRAQAKLERLTSLKKSLLGEAL